MSGRTRASYLGNSPNSDLLDRQFATSTHHFDALDDARGGGEEAPPEAGAHAAEPAALEAVLAPAAAAAFQLEGVRPPPQHLPDHDRVPTHHQGRRRELPQLGKMELHMLFGSNDIRLLYAVMSLTPLLQSTPMWLCKR